jgi:hypothetical protein
MPTNKINATPTATAAGLDNALDVNFIKLSAYYFYHSLSEV